MCVINHNLIGWRVKAVLWSSSRNPPSATVCSAPLHAAFAKKCACLEIYTHPSANPSDLVLGQILVKRSHEMLTWHQKAMETRRSHVVFLQLPLRSALIQNNSSSYRKLLRPSPSLWEIRIESWLQRRSPSAETSWPFPARAPVKESVWTRRSLFKAVLSFNVYLLMVWAQNWSRRRGAMRTMMKLFQVHIRAGEHHHFYTTFISFLPSLGNNLATFHEFTL